MLRSPEDSLGSSLVGSYVVFRAWVLSVRYPCIGASYHIGKGWRQPLIGFDLLWRGRGNEVGDTPCNGSGDKNGRSSKSPPDHFFVSLHWELSATYGHAKALSDNPILAAFRLAAAPDSRRTSDAE